MLSPNEATTQLPACPFGQAILGAGVVTTASTATSNRARVRLLRPSAATGADLETAAIIDVENPTASFAFAEPRIVCAPASSVTTGAG